MDFMQDIDDEAPPHSRPPLLELYILHIKCVKINCMITRIRIRIRIRMYLLARRNLFHT